MAPVEAAEKKSDTVPRIEGHYSFYMYGGKVSMHVTCSIPRCPLRSHSLVCIENNLFVVGIGPILNKELELIFRSDRSDHKCRNWKILHYDFVYNHRTQKTGGGESLSFRLIVGSCRCIYKLARSQMALTCDLSMLVRYCPCLYSIAPLPFQVTVTGGTDLWHL